MFQSHFRERFMPRRKVAPTATVSKVPEDVEVIAVSADVHVSGQEQVASAGPPVGQGAIPKSWTRGRRGMQTSAPEAVVEHPSPVVRQPPSPPAAPPIPKRWMRASSKSSSDSDSSVK